MSAKFPVKKLILLGYVKGLLSDNTQIINEVFDKVS